MGIKIELTRMAQFKPEGAYAGIPYRILPDAAIEVLLPGGIVKFKDLDQLMAWATNNYLPKSNAVHQDVGNATIGQTSNVPMPTKQLDYHSALVDAIEKTKKNSAQLRHLVYEQARFNFKRDLLYGHPSLGLSDLVKHINDFELAVARIEANADDRPSSSNHPNNVHERIADRRESNTSDSRAHIEHNTEHEGRTTPGTAIQILTPRNASSPDPEFPKVQRFETSPHNRWDKELGQNKRPANPLAKILAAGIVLTGIVLILGTLWFLLKTAPEIVANSASKVEKVTVIQQTIPKDEPPKLPYPIPASFGIYVLSENKLSELQALPMNVPDPRVALSAEIKTPSTTIIFDNKPSFILFRRDLINSVPQKIALRVVALLMRQTKFVDGKVTSTNVQDVWRIRNIERELRVSPIPGQNEMVIARLEGNDPLAAGRYELALNRIGYDFTVAGPIKASAQCLEQFESTAGPIYSECRTK